jgi:hypothetical protein
MPIGIYSNPPSLDEATYRRTTEVLEAKGPWPPPGLLHHSCFTEGPTRIAIYEVWESEEAFRRFSEDQLIPAMKEVGFEAPPPAQVGIINLIQP